MAGPNFPCRNPKVCGVKSHRNGTQAKCMNIPERRAFATIRREWDYGTEGGVAVGGSRGYSTRPEPWPLDENGEAVKQDIHAGQENIEVELSEGHLGERRFLLLNTNVGETVEMPEYWSHYMNRSEGAKIITASGAEAYAGSHRGGSLTRSVFSDGVVRTGPVIPINSDGDLMDSHMTAAEYDSLCDVDQEAEALGYTNTKWADLNEQEIIGRAVEMAKFGWTYQPQSGEPEPVAPAKS